MKRLHISLAVDALAPSVEFYGALFGTPPTVLKADYAKWMLDDPRVNFVLDARGGARGGVDHLGVQVDARDELAAIADRVAAAGGAVARQNDAHCCYARADKAWATDPQGLLWETFLTRGEEDSYGEDSAEAAGAR